MSPDEAIGLAQMDIARWQSRAEAAAAAARETEARCQAAATSSAAAADNALQDARTAREQVKHAAPLCSICCKAEQAGLSARHVPSAGLFSRFGAASADL